MAKVQGPLFSVDARGKIGNSLVFMGWRGIKTVRSYAVPSNPNTPAQIEVRQRFTKATQLWGKLTGKDQQAWRASASGQEFSGFNDLVKRAKDIYDEDGAWVLFSDAAESAVTVDSATITINGDVDQSSIIRYGNTAGSYANSMPMTVGAIVGSKYPFTADLTGLPTNSPVYYIVEIVDAAGFAGRSGEYSFSTPSV